MSGQATQKAVRAARISAVESVSHQLTAARLATREWQAALDHALWEAQRDSVEVRLLAAFTGYSVQAVYQAIARAKERERVSTLV